MPDNFKTGGNEPPCLLSLYEIYYCTFYCVRICFLFKNGNESKKTKNITIAAQKIPLCDYQELTNTDKRPDNSIS